MYTASVFAVAGMTALVNAHGFITSPQARLAGSAMEAACGQQVYYNQESDNYGNIQGELQVAATQTDYNAAECDIWLCKGYKFADNTANVQTYTAGQVVPIVVDIRAPHTGYANVSVVKTSTNTMISDELISWDVYASTSVPIPSSEENFSITMPDLGGECATAGDCVIQWYWNAESIDQTYESCIDFTMAGSGSASAVSSSAAVSSTEATSAAASTYASTSSVAVVTSSSVETSAAATSASSYSSAVVSSSSSAEVYSSSSSEVAPISTAVASSYSAPASTATTEAATSYSAPISSATSEAATSYSAAAASISATTPAPVDYCSAAGSGSGSGLSTVYVTEIETEIVTYTVTPSAYSSSSSIVSIVAYSTSSVEVEAIPTTSSVPYYPAGNGTLSGPTGSSAYPSAPSASAPGYYRALRV